MVNQVISFHYTLTDEAGKTVDSSAGGEPLAFLAGSGQIIPGLEKELTLLKKGDKKTIHVPCQDAYGEFSQSLVYKVAKDKFPSGKIKTGDMLQLHKGDSYQIVTVLEITDDEVTLDANHPLAGKNLDFAVEIIDMRPATSEEMSHGHVHGAGGHHH